jgi:hypothetical protein
MKEATASNATASDATASDLVRTHAHTLFDMLRFAPVIRNMATKVVQRMMQGGGPGSTKGVFAGVHLRLEGDANGAEDYGWGSKEERFQEALQVQTTCSVRGVHSSSSADRCMCRAQCTVYSEPEACSVLCSVLLVLLMLLIIVNHQQQYFSCRMLTQTNNNKQQQTTTNNNKQQQTTIPAPNPSPSCL